jgi:hypothetical protein
MNLAIFSAQVIAAELIDAAIKSPGGVVKIELREF